MTFCSETGGMTKWASHATYVMVPQLGGRLKKQKKPKNQKKKKTAK